MDEQSEKINKELETTVVLKNTVTEIKIHQKESRIPWMIQRNRLTS